MKKPFRIFFALLPHITLILSLMLLTFFGIDLFNESMAFLNNTITKYLVGILSLLTVILSVFSVLRDQRPR